MSSPGVELGLPDIMPAAFRSPSTRRTFSSGPERTNRNNRQQRLHVNEFPPVEGGAYRHERAVRGAELYPLNVSDLRRSSEAPGSQCRPPVVLTYPGTAPSSFKQ
jgi:hypothetical protein